MAIRIEKIRSLIRINRDVPALPFIIAGCLLLALGLVGVVRVFVQGHEAVYGVTRQVPWGLLIATYAYFVIISTGLAFIGGLGHAFGVASFAKMSRRIVMLAFVVLLAGFTQIGMELGHPFRLMYLLLLSPHFSAPIVWMGLFYTVELVILGLELIVIFYPSGVNHRLAAILGFLGLLVGVIATSNLGFVFGSLSARPFYHGIYFPVFLVISGIAGGAALLMVVYNIVYKLKIPETYKGAMKSLERLMGLSVGVMILLLVWKVLSSLYSQPGDAYAAVMTLIAGPLAPEFWIGEVLMALILPLGMLVANRGRSMAVSGIAGLVFLVGMFFTRFNFIVAGQLPPMRAGNEGAGVETVNGLMQYAPSTGEWMIFALGLGVFFFLYFMAERFLEMEIHSKSKHLILTTESTERHGKGRQMIPSSSCSSCSSWLK
ncbi:MAG: NrfD/PsrC family molybdoenzyme membrane anchor subunit [Thermodesulfobacteriota bacterium]|nr:NrfD/PsrC family molybdoenzyme membrane anchor subunit [Thermodesulfobacteriota bacterium]